MSPPTIHPNSFLPSHNFIDITEHLRAKSKQLDFHIHTLYPTSQHQQQSYLLHLNLAFAVPHLTAGHDRILAHVIPIHNRDDFDDEKYPTYLSTSV